MSYGLEVSSVMAFPEHPLCARPKPRVGMQDDGSVGLALKGITSNVGAKTQ